MGVRHVQRRHSLLRRLRQGTGRIRCRSRSESRRRARRYRATVRGKGTGLMPIYGLIDADSLELRYIGQTQEPERRRKRHLGIWPNLRTIVLDSNPSDPNEAETAWIVYASMQGARLLNKRHHGYTSGRLGKHCSEEDKTRKRIALLGRPQSVEHILAKTTARNMSSLVKAHQNGKTAKIRSEHARTAANARWGN